MGDVERERIRQLEAEVQVLRSNVDGALGFIQSWHRAPNGVDIPPGEAFQRVIRFLKRAKSGAR